MALHLLPTDALAHVLHRLPTHDLHRIALVPSRTLATAAAADSIWLPLITIDFGAAMAALVAAAAADPKSVETHTHGDPNSALEDLEVAVHSPEQLDRSLAQEKSRLACWLLDLAVQESSPRFLRRAFETYCHLWRRQPSLRSAHCILEWLVPRCFESDPDRWVAGLTRGEGTEEEQARVLARFAHHNGSVWAASRERGSEDCKLRERCCLRLSLFMTTPKSCAQASLAMAACRAYVSSFDLAGKNLVPALRIFLEITKPPKEQQRLCRLLWAFSGAFYDQQTQGMWVSHDAVYLLVMSLVVLHTDAHSPVVKTKMKEDEWVRNTQLSLELSLGTAAPSSSAPSTTSAAATQDALRQMYRDVKTTHLFARDLDKGSALSASRAASPPPPATSSRSVAMHTLGRIFDLFFA